uniref:DDT domain-containing protein PTM-like n=1 Tax=Erigeron canadensis TaxID=72917 RepID=UPI001CB8E4DE|nr:DDT domain-containing protein PTM-like [Erigeron canadensis]XP_043608956.1 DDT domain-containing protein PTM-like [Erigeron canadensis]
MEPEVVKRRGRKRKRKDGDEGDKTVNKAAKGNKNVKKAGVVPPRSKVFIGKYVKKEFDESGEFLGKIVSYDSGLYRVDYEDGDCEDLESKELKKYLVEEKDMDSAFHRRKKGLDERVRKKYGTVELEGVGDKAETTGNDAVAGNKVETSGKDAVAGNKVETVGKDVVVGPKVEIMGNDGVEVGNVSKVETVRSDSCAVDNGVELANVEKIESSIRGGAFEVSGAQDEVDSESSSDSSDDEPSGNVVEVESPPLPPPPQLPPSSGNFGIPEEYVSYLLSVYSFLRSFSVCLFLSPFGLDELVGALNSTVNNTLLDAIHVSLMRALKSHVEALSSEGSEVASKCVRSMDWSLLDSLTWPMFVVQYLMTMRYAEGEEWKDFYVNVLGKDYYTLSAGRKLRVLQILCDDASNSAELRAEIDMREESEVGLNTDEVLVVPDISIPITRRGRPPKNPFFKDQEAVKDNPEIHARAMSSTANAVVSKATGSHASVDVDEDGNGDECRLCGMDGTLLCCDGCPSSYHSRCIGVMKMFIPEGEWYCPECIINRGGPKVTKTTSLKGAEFFGVDPYEQVFLGSCDHLLVMRTSRSSELHIRYYSPADIQKVVHALTFSAEHRTLYLKICKGILQYWEVPEQILYINDSVSTDKNHLIKDGENSTSSASLSKESSDTPNVIDTGNANGVAEYYTTVAVASCPEEIPKGELGFGNPSLTGPATCVSENGNCNINSNMSSACNLSNMSSHKNEANLAILSSEEKLYMDSKLYMGSSFKPQTYLNVYIHGDFAASAGASLAILSSEEKLGSQAQPSSNHRKFMSANFSLQAKAFSLAAKRFYWPNYEKKLVEFSRERCGWCLACRATVSSKKGCLLNAAAANAIKGAAKILSSLSQSKIVEGSLASIATYLMYMEESFCGLTVGPFLNARYRIQWRKQVEEASTLGEIKAYLLEFERNIRDIAFLADWVRLVDDMGIENQATQSVKSVVGSTQKRGPGRRGRKSSIIVTEMNDAEAEDVSTDFAWWRGGMLSKHIFQKGILPQMLVKHAARKGGCGKISGVQYLDGLEVPKRSRQFLWRAAVDMSKTASQLALQVRYLDLHLRWNDLVCPEQPLQDGKGPEAEASAFRNACIVDKRTLGNKITYGVVFENQKHLPSRVLKKVLEIEETMDKTEKNWFVEMHIPLYQIKDYEMRVMKTIMPTADKHVSSLSRLRKKQLMASGKDIFSFLSQKRDTSGICFCNFCQLEVPFRIAARCVACQGYCHEQCAIGSNIQISGRLEFSITCKRCYVEKDVTPKNEIVGDSPTSPLLLQGQESQHTTTVINAGTQIGFEKPLEYSNQSLKKNLKSNQSKISKSGKQNGYRRPLESFDQSSVRKQSTKNFSTSSKKKSSKSRSLSNKLCLGLIWKRRTVEETGEDFRKNNLILKNSPDGYLVAPKCHLCARPYNSDLLYIRCEKCNNWFHAESVELQESKIGELYGFKCCRCRRIRIPICPYTDPEERVKLEARKAALAKFPKQKNLESDSYSDSEFNDEQLNDWDLDVTTPLFDSEEAANVQEEYPYYSFPTVDQVNDYKADVKFEPSTDAGPVSGPGLVSKKLPVRRHIKSEKGSEELSAINPAFEIPQTYLGNNLKLEGDSSTPIVEWDVSTNVVEDDMMFDYGDLNYEDMEFEPQTYFSFNELLASTDEGVPVDKGDQHGAMPENLVHLSAPSTEDFNVEQYQMGITYGQQEPMFSVESGLDMVPCKICSMADPCPDLFCQNCGLWIHQVCSPWDEDSSWEPETGWKCGNCREWN